MYLFLTVSCSGNILSGPAARNETPHRRFPWGSQNTLTCYHCIGIMATRAIVYESNGDPASVLRAVTLPPPGPLSGRSINVKVLLSPINPSDVHAVHGSYPAQPAPRKLNVNGEEKTLYLPGNEGLGEITEVGPDVKNVKGGDWVIFSKGQSGTWSSAQVLEEDDVIVVDKRLGISAVNVSTLIVSRSTGGRSERTDSWPFSDGAGESCDCSQDAKRFRRFEAG